MRWRKIATKVQETWTQFNHKPVTSVYGLINYTNVRTSKDFQWHNCPRLYVRMICPSTKVFSNGVVTFFRLINPVVIQIYCISYDVVLYHVMGNLLCYCTYTFDGMHFIDMCYTF